MQLSTRGRYAVMALVDLATRQTLGCACGRICIAEIAARQNLSQAYLEQLFGKLRRAGLVSSARGPRGGYRLARPSDRIAIADIVAAVEEPLLGPPCEGRDRCQADALWQELDRHIRQFLHSVTLADVVTGQVAGRNIPLAAD
jgi:Rrf2 family iron-sulfur cluster assembly transcriptional regulator